MKMFAIAAAAAVTLTGLAPVGIATSADAQRVVVHERTVVRHDRARHHDRWRTRRTCSWQWRGHHKVRVCRNVRYRY